MSENKQIAINAALRWTGEILNKVIWFGFIIVLARRIGSEGFGYFNYAFSFASLLVAFTDLGTNVYLVKKVSVDNNRAGFYLSNIYGIKVIVSLIAVLLALIIPKDSPQVSGAVVLFAVALLASAFLDPLNSLYRARKQMFYETVTMLVWRALTAGLSIAGMLLLRADLNGIAWAFIAASVAAVAVSVAVAQKAYRLKVFSFNEILFDRWPGLLRGSIPLGLFLVMGGIIFKFNVIFLQYVGDANEVAWYSAAFKLIEGSLFVPSIFVGSLFPFLCENNEGNVISAKGNRLFKKALFFLALTGLMAAMILTLFSNTIISVLYGAQYLASSYILKILGWGLLFIYLNELLTYLFFSVNRQRSVLKNLSVSLVVYFLLCVILIPGNGAKGTAWVLLITQSLLFLLNLRLLKRTV